LKSFALALIMCLAACSPTLGLGQDQLYTGDAETVPPGDVQFQLFYNTAFSAGFKLSGTSFTFGATHNLDVKLSYGYLWNDRGPNVQIGPNVGTKWRFLGNGRTDTSASLSALYAINRRVGGQTQKNDIGGLLVLQHPTRLAILLLNLGRVWVGEDLPDLRYLAAAAARRAGPRVLLAAEYIEVGQLGSGPPSRSQKQYVLALVYQAKQRTSYSLQLGNSPTAKLSHWNVTFGFSKFL
jgi:hypothetical protein